MVAELDERTLLMPDWPGNNRFDSLRNIVRDPRLALLFMVPGCTNVVRVNGRGQITADDAMCARVARRDIRPRTVLVITFEEIYFQCAKALIRSELWQEGDRPQVPTAGELLKAIGKGQRGGADDAAAYDARAKARLWARESEPS